MIDQTLVGAILRRDLTGIHITRSDVRRLCRERVVADVCRLLPSFPEAAEPAVASLLQETVTSIRVRSLALAAAANRVTTALEDADVPVLVYKGVALAAQTTGSWYGRQSSDVDILIDRSRTGDAHRALLGAGLERLNHHGAPSRLTKWHSIETTYAGWPVSIDLHWDVEFPGYFNIPFAESWSRRVSLDESGLRVKTFGRPESLLVTAVHGTREEWRSFRQILDFAELAVDLSAAEWNLAQELSRRGSARSLASALTVAGAAGCVGLPAIPTARGKRLGAHYLPTDGGASEHLVGRRPIDALNRRRKRWAMAPNLTVATHGFSMATVRQLFAPKRSWTTRSG